MVNEDYIDVKLNIFEYTGQRARVKKNLTVRALIYEILKEFDDIPDDTPEKYAIYLKGIQKPLNDVKTLTELDIQPQDELIFDHFRKFIRQSLPPEAKAYLIEENSGTIFEVLWQPAVIGRPSTEMDHNILLAVNLQVVPDGNTVSRSHARISYAKGSFFIEPLAEYNPVYLNGQEVPVREKSILDDGDQLELGYQRIPLVFVTRLPEKQSRTQSAPEVSLAEEEEAEPINTVIDVPSGDENQPPVLKIIQACDPENLEKMIEIEVFPFTLGRTHPLLMEEGEVSRKHAEFSYDSASERYYIKDLKSTNGVKIEGKLIPPGEPVEIIHGCRISLGSTLVLRFVL